MNDDFDPIMKDSLLEDEEATPKIPVDPEEEEADRIDDEEDEEEEEFV